MECLAAYVPLPEAGQLAAVDVCPAALAASPWMLGERALATLLARAPGALVLDRFERQRVPGRLLADAASRTTNAIGTAMCAISTSQFNPDRDTVLAARRRITRSLAVGESPGLLADLAAAHGWADDLPDGARRPRREAWLLAARGGRALTDLLQEFLVPPTSSGPDPLARDCAAVGLAHAPPQAAEQVGPVDLGPLLASPLRAAVIRALQRRDVWPPGADPCVAGPLTFAAGRACGLDDRTIASLPVHTAVGLLLLSRGGPTPASATFPDRLAREPPDGVVDVDLGGRPIVEVGVDRAVDVAATLAAGLGTGGRSWGALLQVDVAGRQVGRPATLDELIGAAAGSA